MKETIFVVVAVALGIALLGFAPTSASILSDGSVRVFPVLGDGVNSDKHEAFVDLQKINSAVNAQEAQASVCTLRTRASNGYFWAQPPSWDPASCATTEKQGAKEYALSKGFDCGFSKELGEGESCTIWKPTNPVIPGPYPPLPLQPGEPAMSANPIIAFLEAVWKWFKSLFGM